MGSVATSGIHVAPLPESLRNCYWVIPGRLLAGMHPWSESRTTTLARLRELRTLGVDWIGDLSNIDECVGYAAEYPGLLANFGIEHHRFGLPDHTIPADTTVVTAALDALDAALGANRRVYLHCRAGIGRTGLLLGCWLTRQGLQGEAALARLNELWSVSRLASTWPRIPETDQQAQYVLEWQERPSATAHAEPAIKRARPPTVTERYVGAVLGMAVAESVALEPELLRSADDVALGWGGHTAMTLCLAESLVARRGNDPHDQMQRYLEWQRHARPTSTGVVIGAPEDLKRALAHWQWTRKPIAGSHDPARSDPHSLPRSVAAALYFAAHAEQAIHQAAESSRTTQQSPIVLDACRCVAALTVDACAGVEPGRLVNFEGPAARRLLERNLKEPIKRLVEGDWRAVSNRVPRAESVRTTLGAVLRALAAADRFETGLAHLVESEGNAVTAAALYGALAGVVFGSDDLPARWLEHLRQRSLLDAVACKLLHAGRTH